MIIGRKLNKKSAMTLAEVLITLLIIGVVSAMTISTINNAVQDASFKTNYKKSFAVASNVFNEGLAENAYISFSSTTDYIAGYTVWDFFKSKFVINKECTNNNNADCWSSGESSNGAPMSYAEAFVDLSGTAWSMRGVRDSSNWASVNIVLVDTNGDKKPNKFGKDRFTFVISLDGNGAPTKLTVPADIINGDSHNAFCFSGPCYYQRWLLN